MLLGTVTIFTSGNKAEIKNVVKSEARCFAEAVRARMSAAKHEPITAVPTACPGGDLTNELTKLGALRAQGILTEEELVAAKRKLLGL